MKTEPYIEIYYHQGVRVERAFVNRLTKYAMRMGIKFTCEQVAENITPGVLINGKEICNTFRGISFEEVRKELRKSLTALLA